MTAGRTRRAAPKRIRAWRYGRWAERLCALVLRLKGYRILDQRHRNPAGEIDIVAKRGHTLAFVEVKARSGGADAIQALDPRQRARIERAAEAWLARNPGHGDAAMRFDVMLVSGSSFPRHILDAWRPE